MLGEQSFITGINYWASHAAINMWRDWDAATVDADFARLKSAGITMLRVFPLWPDFQPLCAMETPGGVREYRLGEDPLPDTEAGRAGVSETACAHFDEFCDLAERHGLRLLVGLITGHMSFRNYYPPAFANRDMLTDPVVLRWQLRFVRYFVRRFRTRACIAGWDLGNEVNNMKCTADQAYVWMSAISDAIRSCDPDHPVVSGMGRNAINPGAPFSLADTGELMDILTVHPYNIFTVPEDPLTSIRAIHTPAIDTSLHAQLGGKPAFVQEFGAIGYMTCTEATERDFYRAVLYDCWAHGCGGAMWWCAFDQDQMTYAPYDWNNIGSQYGFFRSDGTEKPIAAANRDFRAQLDALPYAQLPPAISDGVILLPRDSRMETLRASALMAMQANRTLTFCDPLTQPIPDAPLYVMPSVQSHHAITRHQLLPLLDRVRAGATLYLSLDGGLFRWMPELAGVSFADRSDAPGARRLEIDGKQLPVTGGKSYTPAEIHAEVLGTVDGVPAFFRHAYGAGTIYLLTVPIERTAGAQPGAFHRPDAPDYAAVYRKIASQSARAADSTNRFVRLTEHPLDDAHRVLVAINYSAQPQTAALRLQPGWRIEAVDRGICTDGVLSVPADDAALVRICRGDAQ